MVTELMESTKIDTGKATASSLGDMTRRYANKNIWAVLKQEMKNGNITKTFPRADIWAGCQFFKNHCQWQFSCHSIWRQLCRQTAYERKMPTSLSGCTMKNKTPGIKPKCCFRRWNASGESTLAKWQRSDHHSSVPGNHSVSKTNSQLIHIKFTRAWVHSWRNYGWYFSFPNFL